MKETKFKQTEVGMIPSDWEVKTLGSLTDKCSYGVGAEARVYCDDVKYIRITDIDDESHRFSPSPITSPSFFQEKHIVQKNDLLVARTGASVGKSYLYDEKDGKLVYAGFLMKLNVFNADSKYVFYNTLTKSYWNWVASESARTGQPGLNLQQMKLYSIALPPTIKEQQRIANALSDVDTLIANLEKLIAKKKNIKQGAMQQLLTGRKRLPGFGSDERQKECHSERSAKREVEESSGYKMTELGLIPSDWNVKKLKEIGAFSKGAGISRDESNSGNIPAVRYGEIYTKHNDYIKEFYSHISQDVAEKSVKMQRGDLLFSASGETKEDIGKTIAFVDDFDAYAGGDIIIFTPTETIDSIYMGYLLNFPSIAKQKAMKAQGDAVVHITTDSLKKLIICLPSYQEQTAIANVLSDMDTEIATLETKLAKYRKLKTGMMQQLLTGKIRLV